MSSPVVVEEVRLRVLSAALGEPVAMSFGRLGARRLVLVEVVGDDGQVGRGETWANYPAWAWAERLATLAEGVAPRVLGRRVDQLPALHHDLLRELEPLARQAGTPGLLFQALSGIDLALWDLAARSDGMAIAERAGGRVHDALPAYASGVGPDRVEELLDTAVEAGFRAVKLRVGFGREADRRALQVARRRVGDEVDLFVDANQAWTLAEALRMAPVLRDAGVAWVEEPLRHNPVAELGRFVEQTGLAVACGENSYGRSGFAELLTSGARPLLQPDVTKTGGFSEVLPICRMAEGLGLDVAPHFYGNAVGWLATLQLGAACPGVTWVELDIRPNPLRDGLLAEAPKLTDGAVEVPTGPGLGASLDEDRLAALVQPGTEVVVR